MSAPEDHPNQTAVPRADKGLVAFLKQYWLPLVLLILVAIFIIQNGDSTSITFYFVTVTFPLWLAMLIVALVGFVIGWFVRHRTHRLNEKWVHNRKK